MAEITRHDLQDLRRRVLLDRRAVLDGQLDGDDILDGVAQSLAQLIAKLNGNGWIDGAGYRRQGDDGSWPEEIDHG